MYLNTVFKYNVFKYCPALVRALKLPMDSIITFHQFLHLSLLKSRVLGLTP